MDIDFSHRSFKSVGNFGKRISVRRNKLLRQGTLHRKRLLQELRKSSRGTQTTGDAKKIINQTLTKFAAFCVKEQTKVDGELYTEQEILAYVEYLEESIEKDLLAAEIAHHEMEQNRQRALDMKEALRFSRERGMIICPVCQRGHLSDKSGSIACKNGCGMRVGAGVSLDDITERIAGLLESHSNNCRGVPIFKTIEIGSGVSSLQVCCAVCNNYETVV